ncbi:hypothetical protein [Actinomadura rugatobispora]|uniref:Uncharacterized protein n=1 Tax=Actinomadura rugatobispora TaxID=1994 RepID=A0ABW1A5P7_9ACTN
MAPLPAEIPRIVAELGRRFPGVRAWWGRSTGEWWAMTRDHSGRDRLVEADSPAELSRRLDAILTVPRFARAHQFGAPSRPAPRAPEPARPSAATASPTHGRHELPRRGLLRGRRRPLARGNANHA